MNRRVAGVVAMAVLFMPVWADWNDTSTGIDLDKLPHCPLTLVRDGAVGPSGRTTFDGISVVEGQAETQLRGRGKSGKTWELHIGAFLDEVWKADLDGNGTLDYILFGGRPYMNGRTTPVFSLTILLMDEQQLPVPFFTVVYKGENGDGTKTLVDLNHDGHAELLSSNYDEKPSDPHAQYMCSGHWVTQLYRFQDLGIEEFRGEPWATLRFPSWPAV